MITPMGEGGEWPPMLWIGGGQGAGKSTLAWALSRRHDLPLHPVDLWTYDHAARLPASASLDDELARGPERAADAFERTSRLRMRLVLEDLDDRGLGSVPALVEGPQLLPQAGGQLAAGHGIWLIPHRARTRAAREARLVKTPTPGEWSRLEALLARDAVLAERIRQQAADHQRPVLDVPPSPDWEAILDTVQETLGPAISASPKLSAGSPLSQQRRRENAAASRQAHLWQNAANLATPPSYRYACECGRSQCAATWTMTAAQYNRRSRLGPVTAHEHPRTASPPN
jgi:hypothetical protein